MAEGGVQIVIPVDTNTGTATSNASGSTTNSAIPKRIINPILYPIAIRWAPAWFYSALGWLGQTYRDASNGERGFSSFIAGADVDPYRQLGRTRLFVIELVRSEYRLFTAPDVDTDAPLGLPSSTLYPQTDAGLLQMYNDLAASTVFSSVTHCYVPGRVDLAPTLEEQLATNLIGYDPATGLRRILLGSAIAQVVPAGEFAQKENQQIYDPTPAIVPLATSLVYDITTNNAVGVKTFALPVAYVVDQATAGQFAVNRFGTTQPPPQDQQTPGFDYGETAVFEGGPGYDASKATQLTVASKTELLMGGDAFITTQFQATTAHTSIPIGSSVVTGVSALTCAALLPLATFSNQRIVGFYRENGWAKSLGFPILDYQAANNQFRIASSAAALEPQIIYDPSAPFLSGGNLPNVLAKFAAATYVLSPDVLQQMIADAGSFSASGAAAGLSVMSDGLQFDMSSNPSAELTSQLTVPVTATVTTTPISTVRLVGSNTLQANSSGAASGATPASPLAGTPGTPAGTPAATPPVNAAAPPAAGPDVSHSSQAKNPGANDAAIIEQPTNIISQYPTGPIQLPVGLGGNTPITTPALPSQVQVTLDAFVPIEALLGTGITSVPIGTTFFRQPLGSGAQLQAHPAGGVVNLCDAHRDVRAPQLIEIAFESAGLSLTTGVQYVFSLQGTALTARGSDGSTLSATPTLASPDAQHTYVGAVNYTDELVGVVLYPIVSLSLPAPAVGSSSGIESGASYSVGLTFGADQSLIQILDSDQTTVVAGLEVPNPVAADGSRPQAGDLYFGSFVGGASTMTVWAVPVFLSVTPAALPGASFNGTMVLGAVSSGLPAYALQITDSSLFIFTNINVDTRAAGSISSAYVFVAGVAINSAPDDLSSAAFAPSQFVLGLVRQANVGPRAKFVFVPETDSVVIGGRRYMLSIIELEMLTDDPTQRPYPPNFWPSMRYWQFANRHNPYLDVRYRGETENDRVARAQADTESIAQAMKQAQEPLHMYLDTHGMVVWPILGFPFDALSQSIDRAKLTDIVSNIVELLATKLPTGPAAGRGVTASEQVVLPGSVNQANPYTYGVSFTSASSGTTAASNGSTGSGLSVSTATAASEIDGIVVQNLTSPLAASGTAPSLGAALQLDSLQAQRTAANLAQVKQTGPQVEIMQLATSLRTTTLANFSSAGRVPTQIYGFSVYNATTGECYLIELVPTDLNPPDQLPNPTRNATYDPFYVRVVFVQRLKAYNMSIVVPSLAYDQYGHLATPGRGSPYTNVAAKTDDFALGYMWSLYDQTSRFDNLNFQYISSLDQDSTGDAQTYVCTHVPYFSLPSLLRIVLLSLRPVTFACRRRNWDASCTLMVATQPQNTNLYLAFGGGDLVPMRLDGDFSVDNRMPAHVYNLTYTFTSRQYTTAQTISVGNVPFVIAAGTQFTGLPGLQAPVPVYASVSIDPTAGTPQLATSNDQVLQFPPEIYVVGQASTTLAAVVTILPALTDTGGFFTPAALNEPLPTPQFKVIPYNNLIYLVRAVSNCKTLAAVGNLGCLSGLLIDTFVANSSGGLTVAQGARYKRSGLQFFGNSYTPSTMVDSLDTLDFTNIAGQNFTVPTVFVPIPELDASRGFVADIANFLGQQFWTFIYPEVVVQPGGLLNNVATPAGFNLDAEGKPVLSLQKLHFVYDPQAVLFTPNDLTHKYTLQPKQQVLALTNGQIQDGICWRTDHLQDERDPPQNICAQQKLPSGWYQDRPNIIYSSHNRAVQTSTGQLTKGLSVDSVLSVSGAVYNIEESGLSTSLSNDQTGGQLISTVSSVQNMLIAVLFGYDNNDQGTLTSADPDLTNKGVVFLNGYLSATGYSFSSPDHVDVNDVLPSQVPLLDQVSTLFGSTVAFFDTDLSMPRQYWSLAYDGLTAPGLPNYITNVPPSVADPTFSNRTRSLLLNFENQVRPQSLGVMDTFSSVVSVNLHLQNGVTGSIFVNKKADRDVASLGSNPTGTNAAALNGLPLKYDFFLFSRDHYYTLDNASFELIDQGYAMCLIDDGTGTGNKVAKYYLDADGDYNELYTYVLYSQSDGILESNTFTLKVTLAAPANPAATPAVGETPNNVNPQDLAAQINKASSLVYAVFGASSPGQPAAYIPIQAVGEGTQPPAITIQPSGGTQQPAQASPISGAPGFNGYSLNVLGTARQAVQISQIYSANVTYPIAGSTTIQPFKGRPVPFYGSLSHGLDKQTPISQLTSGGASISGGTFGGNGQGSLIRTQFSWVFQGSAAIPALPTNNIPAGSTMKGDSTVFYTFNAVTSSAMDSTGKAIGASGGQYFVDTTDPANPIWVVLTMPKFQLNGTSYSVNLSTTLADGDTSQYTLVVGNKSYPFATGSSNRVQVNRTQFTFNPPTGGVYTVTYASLDAPETTDAPSPITLTPFSMVGGGLPASGQVTTVDVFNAPGDLSGISLGVVGRQYSYDPVHGTVTVTQGTAITTAPVQTGVVFSSTSAYGYVVGFADNIYTVNGVPMLLYSASTTGSPESYALVKAPQMFTFGNNFYTLDVAASGAYVSVTGNGQTLSINPYQVSLNGEVYIFNTNVQPNTVVGGGGTVAMTANNSQFMLDGVQYTITAKAGSLAGATVAGQFNIAQGNVIDIEGYMYELDTMNGEIVANGTTYPLTTSGYTYTITTAGGSSFTVTTEPNAATVTIGGVVYRIDGSSVVGDGLIYPIVTYRTFVDEGTTYVVGNDGVVSLPQPLAVNALQFSDGGQTYTVKGSAAYDGAAYHLISGATTGSSSAGGPSQFTAGSLIYRIRTDSGSITIGAGRKFLVNSGGVLSPNQLPFGSRVLYFGRTNNDNAAFDGAHYYPIVANQFTDTNTSKIYTLSANTAVSAGNSYEIYSNLGQGAYFEVPNGPTYYVNISVADFGTAQGDIYSVFPVTNGSFIIPLRYTLTVAGTTVTVNSTTFGAATVVGTLIAAGGALVKGSFTDSVTGIVYTCIRQGQEITFVDSNNINYPLSLSGGVFTALVPISTGVTVVLDSSSPANAYPVQNNSFVAGTTTYTLNVPVAYQLAAGPLWPMVAGRFTVPQATSISSVSYRVNVDKTGKGQAIKGYVVSGDNQFSTDGKAVYTVNAVNCVKATSQPQLAGNAPNQTVTLAYQGQTLSYTLAATTASTNPAGLTYNTTTKQFSVVYPTSTVIYTVGATGVTDNRQPPSPPFQLTASGTQLSFADTVSGASFSFNSTGNNQISVSFPYQGQFFVDVLSGITFYIDTVHGRVEALLYLAETTRYAFTPADGNTYLIHYDDVKVTFPIITGANVNAGVATVGSNVFSIEIDEVDPVASGLPPVPVNADSFEINGNLYTIVAGKTTTSFADWVVAGAGLGPFAFTSLDTFKLSDPNTTYTIQRDDSGVLQSITATFPILPSCDLISVADEIFVISYATTTAGTLRGQGKTIPIANSAFTLTNTFDATSAKFIFADANIFDAGSVVGQFTVNQIPTFVLGSTTMTLDPVNLVVTDNDGHPWPLLPNPTMFSINGYNYVIDTNRLPHAVVGNNNSSPVATDVTVQSGQPIANSTFTLGGQAYAYVEDGQRNIQTITGTRSYMIAQPELTFKLDSSLLFTLSLKPPAPGSYAGATIPLGTATAGTIILNVYSGTAESGLADFFTYKNVLYTFVKSGGVYVAVQKSYTVYASRPAAGQQQLAVFDMGGTTYMVTDGSTAAAPGAGTAGAGINPGSMWSATSLSTVESQFGVVYGLAAQPVNVVQSGTGTFQFPVTDPSGNAALFDIIYTAGGTANQVIADVPDYLPCFAQTATFTFLPAYAPLTFETGGYNAFTTAVEETATPLESFSAAWNTPITSTDDAIASLITPQGDFSVEFWHSIPVTPVSDESLFTYIGKNALVSYANIEFPDTSLINVTVNSTLMQATTTPSAINSGWRHLALSYTQPYVMVCTGAPFVVANGSGFNFERDFTIAMTVAASSIGAAQGLLYKGTATEVPGPQTQMSFRVTLTAANEVQLDVANADGSTPGSFTGPSLTPGAFYQVLVTKHTKTPVGSDDADSDPYSPPFDPSQMTALPQPPASVDVSGGSIALSNNDTGATPFEQFATSVGQQGASSTTGYIISIAVRQMLANGTWDTNWTSKASKLIVANDAGLLVNSTGASNLVIGGAYDDGGSPIPFGATGLPGNIRDVYLFASAFRSKGIRTSSGFVSIDQASFTDLQSVGMVGCWKVAYDPNGLVYNQVDTGSYAASSNGALAVLAPLPNREVEGIALCVNGSPVSMTVVPGGFASPSGFNYLNFAAGAVYRVQEISIWSMARQPYQVLGDMFGQLIPSNEPFLTLYLPGSFSVTSAGVDVPILPMAKYIEAVRVQNQATLDIDLGSASLDLQGCPAVGRCGPLVSPNIYTPPGIALTVCDTPPDLTTYSVTVNSVTGTLAGVIYEVYVFVRGNVLTLYAGKKMGDLALVWVTQQQGDAQVVGFIEGAPPAPMANLTNKPSYAGATNVSFTAPVTLSYKYQTSDDDSKTNKGNGGATGNYDPASAKGDGGGQNQTASTTITHVDAISGSDTGGGATTYTVNQGGYTTSFNQPDSGGSATVSTSPPKGGSTSTGFGFNIGPVLAALGFGINSDITVKVALGGGITVSGGSGSGSTAQNTATESLNESHKYTVKLDGAVAPYTGDSFMASLNSLSVPSSTVGTPASKTPILPNPNLGGFTTSNPPGALPKTAVTEERWGQRMFVPSPYGQAFVTSQTVDVYQQILLQTNTTFGFLRVPDPKIPRDLNILSFRMSSRYVRPGVLDGMVNYQYNPASLGSGAQTWQTSTGQLSPVYDTNFQPGEVGHDASYMRLVEAYQLKKQIDQTAFNAMARYASAYDGGDKPSSLPNAGLTPGLDFYNEYVWTARGGTQEVKHTYTTNYEEVSTTTKSTSLDVKLDFNAKFSVGGMQILGLDVGYDFTQQSTKKYSVTYSGNVQFDIAASFDGLESDTQMRYAANNDAHYVMNCNSTFNPANQTGLNLIIGSDGLVYNIVPSVTSGAGLPTSDNIDTTFGYQQPPPSYATGNAGGLGGSLEPYDRPGKTKQFRSYAFFLQPSNQNAGDFWNTVVDQNWLSNSGDPDAAVLLAAKKADTSVPWRLFYRVTDSERFLPPITSASTVVPQITPVFAVPVLNPATDFLFQPPGSASSSAHNPHNDVEANIVLVAPTASGLRIGTVPSTGAGEGLPTQPTNIIPFDVAKNAASLISWGDTTNAKLLTALTLSITRQNTVAMAAAAAGGSTKVTDVADPSGTVIYTIYLDPNGLTVNVPANPGVVVYQDVNGNPIQYYDGKIYHALQADYVPTVDGTITYYIQPPSTYDQTIFNLSGDDDLYGSPGDQWRYYLVSGISSNMTASESVKGSGPFLLSSDYTGFKTADTMHDKTTGDVLVEGYVLVQGLMQWPNLNVAAETFADMQVYKSLSVLDTFPIGDPEILVGFLKAQYPGASFVGKTIGTNTNIPDNAEIELVFAKNITTYFNTTQQGLLPQ